ncbi:MAG TPA: reactive intermediate/imine deaminase, partial [Planctomycetaceae bacterium]|nr:reactive intermediate/imine deaminase [Planctomycetaceae bacterium]
NPDTSTSHLPFSPCVVVDRVVYVSGQASVDQTGKIISDTFEGEFRRSIENMIKILGVAGCELKDVIQTRNYVRDEEDLKLYNQLYAEYFSNPLPARATLTNCLPSTIRYEIECIAVIPE